MLRASGRRRRRGVEKIGEEATETVMAAKDAQAGGPRERIVAETADLWFHCLILLGQHDLHPDDVLADATARRHFRLEERAAAQGEIQANEGIRVSPIASSARRGRPDSGSAACLRR